MLDNSKTVVIGDVIMELKIAGLRREMIVDSASLRDDLGIDSLNTLIMLVRIQEALGRDFSTMSRSVAEILTVQHLKDFVSECEAVKPQPSAGFAA